jgi:hypothetical protein
MPSEYDIKPPPKAIWDPPPSTPTRSNGSNKNNSDDGPQHRQLDEDSTDRTIQWSNQAMRVQLWDTFRLARVILEEPVKTHRLTSHVILHAIRKVAEMKLKISVLQRERNDQIMMLEAQATAPTEMATSTQLEKDPERKQEDMSTSSAGLVTTPSTTSHPRGIRYQQSSGNGQHLEDIFNETPKDLEQYQRVSTVIKSKSSPGTTNTTCGSSVDSEALVNPVVDTDDEEQLVQVEALRREILSQPSLEHQSGPSFTAVVCAKSLSSNPASTADEYTKLLRLQSQKQHKEINSLLQSLDSKVQETSQSTTVQINALYAKLEDARSHYVQTLRQHDQRLQNVGPRPTATEARSARMAMVQSKRHQQEMDVMLSQLHDKVREMSEHTSEQIQALYEILQHAKIQQETVHVQALGNLQQQLHHQQQASKDHLNEIVLKYLQTEENLEQELAKTRERLQDQLYLVEEWEHKYHQLEATTIVSPADIQGVLDKVETLYTQLHTDPTKGKGDDKTRKVVALPRSEIAQVNQEVIALLSRLLKKNETKAPGLTMTPLPAEILDDLKKAKEKEAATLEELNFLLLQKEMLVEDTTKVTVEQYAEMTAQGNELYQKELTAILEAEGRRLQEIDSLEAELNHLAFLAVQIEECERDFHHQQEIHQQSLDELRALNQSSTAKIQALRNNLQQTVEEQVVKIVGEKVDTQLSAADLRIRELEQALAQRDAQLESTRLQLKMSQDRVRMLETTITSQ